MYGMYRLNLYNQPSSLNVISVFLCTRTADKVQYYVLPEPLNVYLTSLNVRPN